MKKHSVIVIILAMIALISTSNIVRAEDNVKDDRGTLSAAGTVSESFTPDTAIITLAVETEAKNASEAAASNSKKAQNVIGKINSLINKAKGDSIQTSRYSINPIYEYIEAKGKNILSGYKATNQVTVTTKQLNIVSEIIDTAIANGANRVDGINFTIDNQDPYCHKILADAAKKAQAEAATVAKALGVNIVGIKSINSSCGPEGPRPMFKTMYAESAAMAPDVATPIEVGEIKIQGNVNVEFYVK